MFDDCKFSEFLVILSDIPFFSIFNFNTFTLDNINLAHINNMKMERYLMWIRLLDRFLVWELTL